MVQMGIVWDRTTAFASERLGALLPIAIVLLFLPISVQLAIDPVLVKAGLTARIGVLAVFAAIELLGTLAIVTLALDQAQQAGQACRTAARRWPAMVGVLIVLIVAAGILAAPIGVAIAGSGIDFAAMEAGGGAAQLSPGAALFIGFYAIAYAIVLLWATARLLLIEPVVIVERRGLGAIPRAFALTRGLTWRIVGVILLYAIVAGVAALAAQTVFGSILRLIAPDDGDVGIASVITAIIVGAVSTGFKVLAAIFVAKLYLAIHGNAEGLAEPS